MSKFHVFISHAYEDKEEIVSPLVKKLKSAGLEVWYDKDQITLGASLNQTINEGLNKSKFGVVILTPNYLRKYWTIQELNGLVTKERIANKRLILPLFKNLSIVEIHSFSPVLADRFAIDLNTNDFDSAVEEIKKAIKDVEDIFVKVPEGEETSSFYISKFPVTNFEYRRFINDEGYNLAGLHQWWSADGVELWKAFSLRKDHKYLWKNQIPRREDESVAHPSQFMNERYNNNDQPVVGVSWFEAEAYCKWLTDYLKKINHPYYFPGAIVRLPTEVEWEYAAMGPKKNIYPWGDHGPNTELANFNYSGDKVQPPYPSAFGKYPKGMSWCECQDLAGNVWEWCHDFPARRLVSDAGGDDNENSMCVIRGGCCVDDPKDMNQLRRGMRVPGYRHGVVGFRVVIAQK